MLCFFVIGYCYCVSWYATGKPELMSPSKRKIYVTVCYTTIICATFGLTCTECEITEGEACSLGTCCWRLKGLQNAKDSGIQYVGVCISTARSHTNAIDFLARSYKRRCRTPDGCSYTYSWKTNLFFVEHQLCMVKMHQGNCRFLSFPLQYKLLFETA